MTSSRSDVAKARRPIKPKWHKRLIERIRYLAGWIRVWLGLAVWATRVYNRPKRRVCPFHGVQMKRGRKTVQGAYYWCRKCKRYFHLEGGSTQLVPANQNRGKIKF